MFFSDKTQVSKLRKPVLYSRVFIAADMSKTANDELFGVHITIGVRDFSIER